MPSSTSTVWVRIGDIASGLPATAAMPTAIMAPEIKPPGRCVHKNSAPPAAPMTSVSSTLRVLARLGTADATIAERRLTPSYVKSARRVQMRQRNCSNAGCYLALEGSGRLKRSGRLEVKSPCPGARWRARRKPDDQIGSNGLTHPSPSQGGGRDQVEGEITAWWQR